MAVTDIQKRAIDKYRSKYVQVAVLLPRELEPIVREVSGGRKAGYMLDLVKADLEKRGLLKDSE